MINGEKRKQLLALEKKLSENEKKLNNKISAISTCRVISFLLGAAMFFIGIGDGVDWALIFGIVFILAFAGLVVYHGKVYRELDIIKSRLSVCNSYSKRFDGSWRELPDDGGEYLTEEDTVAMDLDLLGKASLYQLINVAHTPEGKERLAASLKLKKADFSSVKEKSAAIKELIDKTEFAVVFEGNGILLEKKNKKNSKEELKSFLADKNNKHDNNGDIQKKYTGLPVWAAAAGFIAPLIFIATVVLWLTGITGWRTPLICFMVILAFSWLTKSLTASIIAPLYGMNYCMAEYADMLQCIDGEDFSAPYLQELKKTIGGEDGALKAFKKLGTLCQAYNISYNPLIHQIMSGTLLWDYHLARYMQRWKNEYGSVVVRAFDIIGIMEELISLSVIGVVRKTGWAEIDYADADNVSLYCENLYHPLINPETVVPNSCGLEAGITIITGSNMSGKTTFLRTLAVNLVLAYMGAPICGERLNACYMQIFTSMRVTDDVANGISTFYAEILRIKAMAEYKKKGKPMLCLIDEIFKGTNSADRIVGAAEAIKRLSGEKCMAVVSTHDFELCEIQDKDGRTAHNYHFEEYYDNGELSFDYTIKNGKCTTTNARELLKLAGFFSD